MDYERGLEQLKQYLRGTTWEHDFLVYEARLRENLHRERLFGTSEQQRSDRAQIIDQLNRLAQQVHVSFNDLCLTSNTLNFQAPPKPNNENVPPTFSGKHNSGIAAHNSVRLLTAISRSHWQRRQGTIIAIACVLMATIFASTALHLLTTSPSPSPASQATGVSDTPTVVSSSQNPTATATPQETTSLSPTTTNYQFICSNPCNGSIGVMLKDIKIDSTSQTMTWDFAITNNGTCSSVFGDLSLEGPTGNELQADGGTFNEVINVNSGQELPTSATFSSIPKQGVQYIVTLQMFCGSGDFFSSSYQPAVSSSYQSAVFNY